MARNTQLLNLLVMLRQEIGRSSSVAVGVDDALGLKQKLRRTQELLYDEYDWPHLRTRWSLPIKARQRYYNLPTSAIYTQGDFNPADFSPSDFPVNQVLNVERIEEVWYYYNNIPRPVERGIGEEDFRSFNSDIGVRSSPMLKWDVRWTDTHEQIEAWPIPASDGDTLVFRGIRKLGQLINDSDTADLDDQSIVLTCAAELLAKSDAGSAAVLGRLAGKRIDREFGRMRGAAKRYRLGMGATSPQMPSMVVVRTS